MNFSIALAALFCLSAVSAAPAQEPNPFVQAFLELVRGSVKQFEKLVPDWDPKASVGDNVDKQVNNFADKRLALDFIPGWNPQVSIEDNVLNTIGNYTQNLTTQGFDENKTITENIDIIVTDLFKRLSIPSFFPKELIEQLLTNNFLDALKKAQIRESEKNNNTDGRPAHVKGVDQSATFKDLIDADVDDFLGPKTNVTLEENVVQLIENILKNLPF